MMQLCKVEYNTAYLKQLKQEYKLLNYSAVYCNK